MRFDILKPLIWFSIVANICLLAAPLHMLQVYDRVLSSGSGETLFYITLITLAFVVVYGFAEMLRERLARRISARIATEMGDNVFEKASGTSDAKTLRDFHTVRNFIAARPFISLFDLPFAPLFLGLLYLLHFQVGLLTTIGVAILAGIGWLKLKSTRESHEKATNLTAQAAGFNASIVNHGPDIHSMGIGPQLKTRWGVMMAQSLIADDDLTAPKARFYGLSRAIRQGLQIMVMAWGGALVLSGDMSGGMIFAASLISGRVLQPVEQVIGSWETIVNSARSFSDIQKLNDADAEAKTRQPDPKPKLNAKSVSFHGEANGQDGTPQVLLQQINLSVEQGEVLGVMGASGSGKSLLLRILAGGTLPTSGEVSLSDCLRENWPDDQWGEAVGYLAQEPMLFSASVAENIARMAVKMDDKKIIKAAQMAGIHEMISALPNGYQTRVGGMSRTLSASQKQGVALARAVYGDPKILILDEPQTHLDKMGFEYLKRCIALHMQAGGAAILCSQSSELMKLVNKIVMLDHGKLVPAQELTAKLQNSNVNKERNVKTAPELQSYQNDIQHSAE